MQKRSSTPSQVKFKQVFEVWGFEKATGGLQSESVAEKKK